MGGEVPRRSPGDGFSLCFSIGRWGGFYGKLGFVAARVVIGWFAVTLFYREIDVILGDLLDAAKPKEEPRG